MTELALTQDNINSLKFLKSIANKVFGQKSICVTKSLKEGADEKSVFSISTSKCLEYPIADKSKVNDLVDFGINSILDGARVEVSCKDDAYGIQACSDFNARVSDLLSGAIEALAAEL